MALGFFLLIPQATLVQCAQCAILACRRRFAEQSRLQGAWSVRIFRAEKLPASKAEMGLVDKGSHTEQH